MRVNCVAPVAKTTKQRGCCSAAPEKKTQGSHQPGEPWVGHQEVAGVKGGNAGECHASHLQKHEATATVPHEKNPRSGGTGAESVSSLAATLVSDSRGLAEARRRRATEHSDGLNQLTEMKTGACEQTSQAPAWGSQSLPQANAHWRSMTPLSKGHLCMRGMLPFGLSVGNSLKSGLPAINHLGHTLVS
jgi:hypothetical protein